MKNVMLSTHDPVRIVLYDQDESLEIYTQEGIDEWGYEVPVDLIQRYKACEEESRQIQTALQSIKEVEDRKTWGG